MMGGGPMHRGDLNDKFRKQFKEPKPKSLKEVPGYLKKVVGGFLYRLFYIFKLVWETRPWILITMVFISIFNGVMPVVGSYIGAALLNSLASAYTAAKNGLPSQFYTVMGLLILQFVYIFAQSIVSNINTVITRVSGELVVNHIKLKIMNKAKEIDLASFDRPEFYEKLENASNEAGHRPLMIMTSVFSIISQLISIISFIVILLGVSPFAPLIIILLSIPSAIISFSYRRKNFQYIRHRSKSRRKLAYYSELLTNKDMAKEIRMFNLSDLFIDRYKKTFKEYFSGLRRLFLNEGYWNGGLSVVNAGVNCALFLYIASKVCAGQMEIGSYSLYTGALNSISGGVSYIISTVATIYEGTLFINNLIDFMAEKKTIVPSSLTPASVRHHVGHTIEFVGVSFRYPGTSRDVIKNFNLKIEPGETLVLVGLNGAGKTTLLKLLTRLYDPSEGKILFDGRDIREYSPSDLYSIFGIIFQDFGRYAVSAEDNIVFGDIEKKYDEDEVVSAAKQSNADEFISHLPDKYKTPLMRIFEDTGIELSGGQWQKLAVARAFYSDSDILILDEPTASLDPLAEQEIYSQFDKLRKEKTTIFVSHRLSNAATADKIAVIEGGELIELGSHSELMELGGKYCHLFSTQAKRYISTDRERVVGEKTDEHEPKGGFGDDGISEDVPENEPGHRPGDQAENEPGRAGERPPMPPHGHGEGFPPPRS